MYRIRWGGLAPTAVTYFAGYGGSGWGDLVSSPWPYISLIDSVLL